MSNEDDYSGKQSDPDDPLFEHLIVFDQDLDDESEDGLDVDLGDETLLHFGGAADGAKTRQEAAAKMYDLAELALTLSAEGWELVDDVHGGYGTAVRFAADEDDDE
jgi:hypothetical protein